MNTRLVNTAADAIRRAQVSGTITATGLAIALDSVQLLQSPETVAEIERTARAEAAPYWRQRAYRAENVQWDDALAPGGEVCAHPDCGQPVESEPCPDHSPAAELELLRARVVELEAQRAALGQRLRAGQRWRRGRTPALVSQDYVSQDELRQIFEIPLTAPWDVPGTTTPATCGRALATGQPCPDHPAASTEAEQLRAQVAELTARLAEYERPVDEDPIAYALTEKAAEADGITRLIAPIQAMRASEAGGTS